MKVARALLPKRSAVGLFLLACAVAVVPFVLSQRMAAAADGDDIVVPDEVKADAGAADTAPAGEEKSNAAGFDIGELEALLGGIQEAQKADQEDKPAAAGSVATDAQPDAEAPASVPTTEAGVQQAVAERIAAREAGAAQAEPETPAQPAVPPQPLVEPAPEELSANEQVRRAEFQLMAEHSVVAALEAWRKGEFSQAVKSYKEAQAKLESASRSDPGILKRIEQVKEALFEIHGEWADSLAEEARELANAEKVDEAIDKCQDAAEIDPSRRKEMDARIKEFQKLKRETEYRVLIAAPTVDVDKVERDREINVLLERGKVFYDNGRYADARDEFEQIILKDPYEVRAIRYLRKIQDRLLEASKEKLETTVQERMAEVAWKWNEPVTPLLATPTGPIGGTAIRKTEDLSGIRRKLEEIVIPKIDFVDEPVDEVIRILKLRSRELDPDGEGVNIFLRLQPVQGAAAAPAAAPDTAPIGAGDFDDFGMAPAGGGGDMGLGADFGMPAADGLSAAPASAGAVSPGARTITMDMDNVPLGEVIRYVCMGAGLQSRIDSTAIIIADSSVAIETMETRYYPVAAGVFDSKKTRSGRGMKIGDDDDDDDWGDDDDDDGAGGDDKLDLKVFFGKLGVGFPQLSEMTYYQRSGKLVATNTPENLRKIEKALQEINITPTQVTIEAKFVEVVQDDLQALGFDWTLLHGGVVPAESPAGSGDYTLTGGPSWNVGRNAQIGLQKDTNVTRGLRGASDLFDRVAAGSDQILGSYAVLGDLVFETLVQALQQQGQSNVLSAPKVTTLSGNTALLKMVTKRYIAVSWSEPEVNSNSGDSGGFNYTPSIAETEEREFGVILEVTPTVAADGYSIDLELNPRVEDFIGYDDSFNYEMIVGDQVVPAKQLTPIMAERSVATKVIIWDGETVVLGGMIGERVTKWEDKVPVLGDVPLLGNLFRSKGEMTEKTNLLIFVTARLVNPAGLPVRANEVRGMPDFRR